MIGRLDLTKSLLGMLCIPSSMVTTVVMIMSGNCWQTKHTNSNNRQQTNQPFSQQSVSQISTTSSRSSSLSRFSSNNLWLRSAAAAVLTPLMNDDNDDDEDIDDDYVVDIRRIIIDSYKWVVVCHQIILEDNQTQENRGTGFRIDSRDGGDGNGVLIVTNYHIAVGSRLVATQLMYANAYYEHLGTVVYVEPHRDLALIQVWPDSGNDVDQFKSRPVATRLPRLGEPIATIGHGQIDYSVHTGIVCGIGCPAYGVNQSYYEVDTIQVANRLLMVYHSAVTVSGNSGGPMVNTAVQRPADAHIFAVTDLGNSDFGLNYCVMASDVSEFLENSKHYMKHIFPVNYRSRVDRYARKPGLILGIILAGNIVTNNRFIIEDLLFQSQCS
ncbi:uncharacterized protein LOC128955171 [Oppia nitens]|uniref:uncharacterized protein LOC128955171 n=1 Tax=Oppia nitens TaxID=1686743 RepID=UPI0023DADA78|nr:uncharacterized protein LOC128955171 [Oppia nitens]